MATTTDNNINSLIERARALHLEPVKKITEIAKNTELVEEVSKKLFQSIQELLSAVYQQFPNQHASQKKPLTFIYYLSSQSNMVNHNFFQYWKQIGDICWPHLNNEPDTIPQSKARYDRLKKLNIEKELIKANDNFLEIVRSSLDAYLKTFIDGSKWKIDTSTNRTTVSCSDKKDPITLLYLKVNLFDTSVKDAKNESKEEDRFASYFYSNNRPENVSDESHEALQNSFTATRTQVIGEGIPHADDFLMKEPLFGDL